ncbi:DUF3284 domain-containing protein [Enterococcus nangangensis]|uniref:DUF3284 domain-containing protein n=1 Tax=Enterococcus nangangensis TaxID=2559926 RepID=UPI0010F82535|nr:DUF3284 domain-containing protein [Enterococcus nangangensis]
MEIRKELQVPAPFFFDKLADSALYDIQRQTGKKIGRQQLRDFEYVKQFNKNSRARIKIDKFVENSIYGFTTSTVRNDFYVEYHVEALDEKKCHVTYVESMKSHGFIQTLNDKTVGILWSFLRKRRFNAMLSQIEQTY